MPGLVPGIHVFAELEQGKTWMAGTSPAMTNLVAQPSYAFFSTETKNPSVPVRRGVISQPSSD